MPGWAGGRTQAGGEKCSLWAGERRPGTAPGRFQWTPPSLNHSDRTALYYLSSSVRYCPAHTSGLTPHLSHCRQENLEVLPGECWAPAGGRWLGRYHSQPRHRWRGYHPCKLHGQHSLSLVGTEDSQVMFGFGDFILPFCCWSKSWQWGGTLSDWKLQGRI